MRPDILFALLILISFNAAAPIRRSIGVPINVGSDPGPGGTKDAINRWRDDIKILNTFMDQTITLSGSALSDAANSAMSAANDEFTNFRIL
jgi:hypothetical protein